MVKLVEIIFSLSNLSVLIFMWNAFLFCLFWPWKIMYLEFLHVVGHPLFTLRNLGRYYDCITAEHFTNFAGTLPAYLPYALLLTQYRYVTMRTLARISEPNDILSEQKDSSIQFSISINIFNFNSKNQWFQCVENSTNRWKIHFMQQCASFCSKCWSSASEISEASFPSWFSLFEKIILCFSKI